MYWFSHNFNNISSVIHDLSQVTDKNLSKVNVSEKG